MPTTMAWGEQIELLMALGFPTEVFTLDSATDGVLGSDYLDGTLRGDDVSPYAQEITVRRGRQDDFAFFDAGSLRVVLRNDDRRFDPTNTSSPYWDATTGRSGVTPRRAVQLLCDGLSVFKGRITDIDIEYDNNPEGTSTVVITAVDDFAILATAAIDGDTTPTGELSSVRINTILDRTEVAYPAADRDIETGLVTLGTQLITTNTNVLTYLQRVSEAEWGLLFVNRDGKLAFRKRQTSAFFAPDAYFNDAGTQLPYQVLEVIYGSEFLYNRVQITNDGGTTQTAEDLSSQAEYGVLTYALNGLLLGSDAQAQTLADYLLNEYSTPTFWFDEIACPANKITAPQRADLFALDLGSQIQLTRNFPNGTPTLVQEAYSIERLGHRITINAHEVTIGLYKPTIVYEFTLNDALRGVLSTDNALV